MSVDFFQFILKPSNWSICRSIHNWDFSSWGDWAINIMSSRYAMILNPLCQVKARIGFRTFVNSLMPTQEIQFLGLMVKSVTMKLALSPEKVKALMKKCRQVLQHQSALVRELSRVIGQMTASIFVILPAPLHYWNLQRLKNEGLRHTQSYETVVPLDVAAKEELQWLCQHLQQWNGKPIVMTDPDMVIETDASLLGWGACCADIRTGRLWLDEERMMHINCLELLGGAFAVKAPGKASKNIHIRLRMDITTAISYINRMGGTHSHTLAKTACSLWQWCLGRGIVVSAEHLPGSQNVIADRESQTFHSSAEWQLHRRVFQNILTLLGQCQVDLFATRLNHQLPQYMSWRPDPFAMATDAIQVRWTNLEAYAFPPFSLVGWGWVSKICCAEGLRSCHRCSVSWHIAVILSWWSWGSSCRLEKTGRPIWDKDAGNKAGLTLQTALVKTEGQRLGSGTHQYENHDRTLWRTLSCRRNCFRGGSSRLTPPWPACQTPTVC